MAELTSGQVNFTGLGNGTDFNTLVDGLIDIERNRIRTLERWRLNWETKVDAFQELNTRMLSLKTTLEGMDSMNEFLTKSVSTSDDAVLTASADSDAETGTHSIRVNQLAQNKILTGQNGYSASTDIINSSGGSQVFAYTYKGTTYSLDVPDQTTLEGLKNFINNDPDNPGVRASLISDGTNSYLQFRGLDLGAGATLEIDASSTLTGFTPADFDATQLNQNSQVRVDGWPASGWISNASNTVTNIIDGLTLNLKGVNTTSDISLVIDNDTEAVKQNVRDYVAKVNEVRAFISEITKVDDSQSTIKTTSSGDDAEQKGSLLTGNYGIQIISQRLKDATSSKGVGFEYYDLTGAAPTGDKYSALSQLGIMTDADSGSATAGQLILDEDKLTAALEDDPDAVARLFAGDYLGGVRNTNDFTYVSHIEGITEAGAYKVEYTVDGSGNITNAYINGHAASIDNTTKQITGVSNKELVGDVLVEQHDEAGLVIRVDNLTAGTYPPSGTNEEDAPLVYLQLGKTGEMVRELESLTDSDTGPLAILEDNYDEIMESIDSKIAYEETRIEKMERTLRLKYARLDALLGQYDSKSASLNSQISQLSE